MFFYNAFMGRLWVGRFKKTFYLSILFCQRKLKYFIVFYQCTLSREFKNGVQVQSQPVFLGQYTKSWPSNTKLEQDFTLSCLLKSWSNVTKRYQSDCTLPNTEKQVCRTSCTYRQKKSTLIPHLCSWNFQWIMNLK